MNDNPIFQGVRRPSVDLQAVRQGLQSNLMQYTFSLATARSIAAGTALILPIGYTSIYVDAGSTGIATFHFQDQNPGGTGITAYPTSAWETPGTQLIIENTAQTGASMTIIFGVDVAFRPSNAGGVNLLNPVNVIDAALQRTQNNISAIGQGLQDAVAGQYPHVQIKNPTGSGKMVFVKSVTLSATNAGGLIWGQYNTDLTTLIGTSYLKNKTAAFTAGITQFRKDSLAAVVVLSSTDGSMGISANTPFLLPLAEPYELQPGQALVFYLGTLNSRLYLTAHDILEQ